MVYVAYGVLVLTLPILYYAHRHYDLRPKVPSQRSKGDRRAIPPEISIRSCDADNSEEPSKEARDAFRHSDTRLVIRKIEVTDASSGGNTLALSSWQDATSIAYSEGLRVSPDSAEVKDSMEESVLLPLEKSAVDTPRFTMQPPGRPGPRLRPKANNKLPSPSPQQASNNALRVPPTLSSSLKPPPSAASSLRTPPSRSLAPPVSLAPTASTLPSAKRPYKKVLLEPGHSPLDWANLLNNPSSATYLRGDDVPSNLVRVTPSSLRYHNGRKGKNAWGVWQGKVFNLTPYMKFHPGGVDELMKGAGREKDGERLFMETHPWVNWEGLLGECMVGILVSEEASSVAADEGGNLDDMD